MAICCSLDSLTSLDDLKNRFHGIILHGVGRSRKDGVIAASDAVNEVKAHLSDNIEIKSILICILGSIGQNYTEEVNMCRKTVMEAFPEIPASLLTANRNVEENGLSVVLLACQSD